MRSRFKKIGFLLIILGCFLPLIFYPFTSLKREALWASSFLNYKTRINDLQIIFFSKENKHKIAKIYTERQICIHFPENMKNKEILEVINKEFSNPEIRFTVGEIVRQEIDVEGKKKKGKKVQVSFPFSINNRFPGNMSDREIHEAINNKFPNLIGKGIIQSIDISEEKEILEYTISYNYIVFVGILISFIGVIVTFFIPKKTQYY